MSWWTNSTADDLRRRLGVLYAVSLLLIAGSVVALQHYLPLGESLAVPDKPSLVVLPFTNLSGDPEQEYFNDGMAAKLLHDLSKLSGLFVTDLNSAFFYKGRRMNAESVSQALGVRYLVKGSARKVEDRMVMEVQVADTTATCYVWAECSVWTAEYDRPLQDIFAVQEELAQKIAAFLDVTPTPEEHERWRRIPTNNLEAYDYFLRGRKLTRMGKTPELTAQAQQMVERAVGLDPQYASAYLLLGWLQWRQWFSQWSHDPQTLRQAFALAQRASVLDDSLADAHGLLAHASLLEGRYDHAISEGEKAVALGPNSAYASAILGYVLIFAGRPEDALRPSEQAMRLDPHHPADYLNPVGQAYWLMEQEEKAIAAYERVLDTDPVNLEALLGLTVIYSESNQEQTAQAGVERILAVDPNFSLQTATKRWPPYKDQAVLARILTALQKAGLK